MEMNEHRSWAIAWSPSTRRRVPGFTLSGSSRRLVRLRGRSSFRIGPSTRPKTSSDSGRRLSGSCHLRCALASDHHQITFVQQIGLALETCRADCGSDLALVPAVGRLEPNAFRSRRVSPV
jgi:hypothetical protein